MLTDRKKKARTEGGAARAGENINNESIAPLDIVCAGKEWHNKLYRHEARALAAAGVSKSGILVYTALTHWEKTPGKVYCVPAPKLSADTGFTLNIIYKAIEELQRKHIIKCVRKGTQGRKGEPGRAAAYVSLIVDGATDNDAESFAVGGERFSESFAVDGERLSENGAWSAESFAVDGESTPESFAVDGELKEHIKKGSGLGLDGPALTPNPSMSMADLFNSLGITSDDERGEQVTA